MIEFIAWYMAIGLISTAYFILFVRTPVMEEFEPIMFRRSLDMPKMHRFPYSVIGFLVLSVVYPLFVYQMLMNIADGSDNVTDDFIKAYRSALWDDIEEYNDL